MSLLMDALKKAEREKNRATKNDTSSTDEALENESAAASETQDNGSITEEIGQEAGDSSEEIKGSAEDDETWAFDTGELELEPIPSRMEATIPQSDEVPNRTESAEKTVETFPENASSNETGISDSKVLGSEFDNDATLPSERAIQSSLKDYFEASQTITMDQASISGPLSQSTSSEHSFTNTSSSLGSSSATHVTAHTIFSASQNRAVSTGVLKYAVLGALLLAIGLGSVAWYYSALTPTIVESGPIAREGIGETPPQESSVSTSEVATTTAPFEPDVDLALNADDPVVTDIVDAESRQQASAEESVNESDSLSSEVTSTATEEMNSDSASAEESSISESAAELVSEPIIPETEQTLLLTAQKDSSDLADLALTQGDNTVDLTSGFSGVQENPEQQNSLAGTTGGGEPLEVLSSENFTESLHVPKSAIRITRGSSRSGRSTDSNLMKAYRAYLSGDFINSKAAYRKILQGRPGNRDARLGLAAIAVQEGKRETAYRHYQYLLEENPKDEVVNAALFNLQGNATGNVTESQLKLLLDQSPGSPQINFSLGNFYARELRWPEAQQAFFDAFVADKTNADYAHNLAVSLDHIGQSKTALTYYRKALELAGKKRVSFNTSKVLARIQKLSSVASN